MNKNSTENINNDPVDTLSNQESSESKKDQNLGYEQSEITKTSSQTGEYLVCQGATCLCDQGEKIHLGLSVLSNKKIFINDSSAVATIDDNVLNGTFQKCKLNPASGKPCIYKPGNKWDWKSGIQAYFSEIGGKKVLTENAILRCPVFPAGTISLSYNGQEIDVLESDKEDLDSSVSSSIICAMDDNVEPDQGLKNKKPSITSIAVTINDKVIQSKSNTIQKITILQNRAYQFSVTDKNKAGFNYWYIREKTEADKDLAKIPYNKDEGLVYEQKGTTAQFTFKQIGLFYIEGFGTINPKNQLYKEATFEVEVLDKNKLTGIKLTPPALESSQESIYQLQAETSYNIQLQALFPLEHEDLDGLVVEIHDTSVRFVPPGLEKLPLFKGKEALSFNLTTAKWGSYTLLVKKGDELVKKYDFPIIENEVKNIKIIKPKVGAQTWVRPGTRVTFEAELSKEQSDNQRFRWKLDTSVLPDQHSKTLERYFGNIAEYKIEASYRGFLNTLPTKTASCSLKVKPNEITAITSSKSTQSLSIGSDVTFKVETPYLDLIDTEYITWELQKIISKDSIAQLAMPSNAMRYSLKPRDITHLGNHVILGGKGNIRKELSIQFNQVANYTLSVRMGTKELFDKPIEINVVKSHIEQWFFCDKDGNRLPKIGWELDFCIRLHIKGCENRKVKIDFWYDTTSDNIDNRFYKIDSGGEIEDFDFVLKEDGLAQWKISSRKLWTSLKELVNKQGSSAKHEYARILFTVSEVDTICDNSKDYAKGHPLYGYIYPTQTDNTTAIIPNKTEYNGSFLDHNKQKLTDIISYTDIAYMSLKRINSPDDTLVKDLEIRLIENRPKQDLEIQTEQIDSFDKEGYFIKPVAMSVLRLTSAGQTATEPRYFYMQLYDKANKKIIYTVPEGYETDGEKNDCEIISLVKDDYTVEEIKNQDLSKIIESNAKLIHNLERLSDFKPAPIVTPEFDEEAFNRKRTEDINIEAQKKNKETIDKSKNYHLQLKVAQESVQQNSRYKRTGKQVGQASAGVVSDCGAKYCITKDNYKSYRFGTADNVGKLIQEINIRLAGFGGNVPTTEFDEEGRTENTIKQFQRDYMNITPTGKICGSLLKAIDEFSSKFDLGETIWKKRVKDSDHSMLCPCGKCDGFGTNQFRDMYNGNAKVEKNYKYEYPGIHRSLLWALKGVIFYLDKDKIGYYVRLIDSGYRCDVRNKQKNRTSTNHCGKALDIHFNDVNGNRTRSEEAMEVIRKDIFNKYLGAKWDWLTGQNDIFNLESSDMGAKTWVHYDVREYSKKYLKDKFFSKNSSQLNNGNESIITFAKNLQLSFLCSCSSKEELNEAVTPKQASLEKCSSCKSLANLYNGKQRELFYKKFGSLTIDKVMSLGKCNKFKALYMVAQRRVENSFEEHVKGNNPMNVKASGDLGQIAFKTKEWINGKEVILEAENFANFSSNEAGFNRYFEHLQTTWPNSYNALFDDNQSITQFAEGLVENPKKLYATAPNYKKRVIEDFGTSKRDYIIWYECMLNCPNHTNKDEIKNDLELLYKLK